MRKDLANLRKAEAHLGRYEKTKLKGFFEKAKIPQQTFRDFEKDPDKFRKNASETHKERSAKYTAKKKGSLSKSKNAVWLRGYKKKLNEGYVPTLGKRKREPVGGYSMNKVTQRSRGCHQKKVATNIAAAAATAVATDMVIDKGSAF